MGARNGFKLQDTASLFNLLGQFDQLIQSVVEDEVWVQIPVTRSKHKAPCPSIPYARDTVFF